MFPGDELMEHCEICDRDYELFTLKAYTSSDCYYPHTPDNVCSQCLSRHLLLWGKEVNRGPEKALSEDAARIGEYLRRMSQ
jgi:hypothetical protein